jgi:thioredoxin 1
MNVINVDDDSFQDHVFSSNQLVLAEFSGPGSSDSAQTSKLVDELARQFDGEVLALRIDKDSCEPTAENFGVDSVPTVIFFRNGSEVSRATGLRGKEWFEQEINKLLQS